MTDDDVPGIAWIVAIAVLAATVLSIFMPPPSPPLPPRTNATPVAGIPTPTMRPFVSTSPIAEWRWIKAETGWRHPAVLLIVWPSGADVCAAHHSPRDYR